MKYAIIGTHGVGKTTLAYSMASKMKSEGKHVKLINETARACPFELNDGFTNEAALWIYHAHVNKELTAMKDYEMIVCDRSAIDSFMYAKAMNLFIPGRIDLLYAFYGAQEWMKTYAKIIYIKKGSKDPLADGTRDLRHDFQRDVEACFDDWVEKHKNDLPIEIYSSDDVFSTLLKV